MSPTDSSAVELAPLREMLRMYCHALSERGVELQDLQQLIDKNIGWSRADVATSDGSAIFLPAIIERFDGHEENFAFMKVMLTQQSGHIEFGSFAFEFDRPSTKFQDLRPRLIKLSERNRINDGVLAATELGRFFQLFPNKRLAFDIFSIIESTRVEASVAQEYRGIAPVYQAMKERTLALRQEVIYLPAREALLEFMIRRSLGKARESIRVPAAHSDTAIAIDRCLQTVACRDATVEDAAEASLRIYGLLSKVPNDNIDAAQFSTLAVTDPQLNGSNLLMESGHSVNLEDVDLERRFSGRGSYADRGKGYSSPQGVDYRGEFNPELAQLLSQAQPRSREQRKNLTPEQLAQLLRNPRPGHSQDKDDDSDGQNPRIDQRVQNLLRELDRRDPGKQSAQSRPASEVDEDAGPLTANQPDTFIYDEWNVFAAQYRSRWCKVHEKVMGVGDMNFYRETLLSYAALLHHIRREFEQIVPELYHKEKRLPDGADHDLDAAIEAMTDLRIGVSPSEKIFWRHHKSERDVAVAFLLDMSGSTGEAISTLGAGQPAGRFERSQRRIIDVEKEAIVLMSDALEAIGDRYGVYGFSGHGRDNVEYYVIKDLDEDFSPEVAKRFGRIGPLHATRMGPAIRHTVSKLRQQPAKSRHLFLISDGRPQDRGYSQESSEKSYAVQDTRMAFIEARREGIHSFCLTVDKEGNDYLRTMMDEFGYEVLADIAALPRRLPQLYKKLTA
jgi:nitric oxide reductase NorD protein